MRQSQASTSLTHKGFDKGKIQEGPPYKAKEKDGIDKIQHTKGEFSMTHIHFGGYDVKEHSDDIRCQETAKREVTPRRQIGPAERKNTE
ncbi:hypothetical protein, partial [Mitsuokella sp.]|uniref:hypothetical protein n=1 Tax=Mitsuokella sp. TaxID=2049034 RepID=UPI003D7C39BE